MKSSRTIGLKAFKTITRLKFIALIVSPIIALCASIGFVALALVAKKQGNSDNNYALCSIAILGITLIALYLPVIIGKFRFYREFKNSRKAAPSNDSKPAAVYGSQQEVTEINKQLCQTHDQLCEFCRTSDPNQQETLAKLHRFEDTLDSIKKRLDEISAHCFDSETISALNYAAGHIAQIKNDIENYRFKIISTAIKEATFTDRAFPEHLKTLAPSVLEKIIQNLESIPESFMYPKLCQMIDDNGHKVIVFPIYESEKLVRDKVLTITPKHAYESIIYRDFAGNLFASMTTWTTGDPYDALDIDLNIASDNSRNHKIRHTNFMLHCEELEANSHAILAKIIAKYKERLAATVAN